MKKLVIEKAAVKNNISVIKSHAGGSAIYGVLSGDGGGAGLVEMAKLLRAEGVGRFAISEPSEAAALRKAGFVDEEILMLRSTTDPEELEQLIDLNVVCTVSSIDTGVALNGVAEGRSTVVEAHLQVDTGLGFGGFLVEEPDKVLLAYRNLDNLAISGIYTQIQGTSRRERAEAQLALLDQLLDQIHKEGFETGIVHVAGSYALLHYDGVCRDAVRAGSALLGRCRRERGDGLQLVGVGEVALDRDPLAPQGAHRGHPEAGHPPPAHPGGHPACGLSKWAGGGAPPGGEPLAAALPGAAPAPVFCPDRKPAGMGGRLCGGYGDPGGHHRLEMLCGGHRRV